MNEIGNYHNSQIIGLVFGIFLITTIFLLVKKKRIQEKHSIIWLFVGLLITIFSLNRNILEMFSSLMGVYYAPSALFAVLITCCYILVLSISVSISGIKKKVRILIQEVGLLKLQIEEMEKKLKEYEKVK